MEIHDDDDVPQRPGRQGEPVDDVDSRDLAGDDRDTMRCPNCRKHIFDDVEQCPYCKHWIAQHAAHRPLWIIIVAVLCLAALVYALWRGWW